MEIFDTNIKNLKYITQNCFDIHNANIHTYQQHISYMLGKSKKKFVF